VSTTRHIEQEGFVSLPEINSTALMDIEQLLPDVYGSVQWAYLRYRGRIRRDELDDLSQQITLKLIEDDCRRLHSFKSRSSSKTWLQAVVDDHLYKFLRRQRWAESLDEVNQGALVCSPPQDRDTYVTEQRRLLFRALGRLSEQERRLYQLFFVFEQDAREVAAVFKINVKNAYKRRQKLVLKLTMLVQTVQNR
jgi:RNA polymerase sigma factor (sigma-70 family)